MFKGSMVAMVTPFTKAQTIDVEALDRIIDFHLANQTDAIVVVGTTGEAATLSNAEKEIVIERTLARVNGRIPVIAGTAAQSTQQAILNTKRAEELGVDGALIMTPAYIKPPQRGLIEHYQSIAKQTDLPIILYNVPGRTAVDLLPGTVKILSSVDNIIAIKEASGSLERAQEIIALCGDNLNVISGEDALNLSLMRLGAVGSISVTANVAPKQMHQVFALASQGLFDEAQKIDETLQGLHKQLFIDANPIPAKWAMSQMSLCESTLRLPLCELEAKNHQVVKSAMEQAGI